MSSLDDELPRYYLSILGIGGQRWCLVKPTTTKSSKCLRKQGMDDEKSDNIADNLRRIHHAYSLHFGMEESELLEAIRQLIRATACCVHTEQVTGDTKLLERTTRRVRQLLKDNMLFGTAPSDPLNEGPFLGRSSESHYADEFASTWNDMMSSDIALPGATTTYNAPGFHAAADTSTSSAFADADCITNTFASSTQTVNHLAEEGAAGRVPQNTNRFSSNWPDMEQSCLLWTNNLTQGSNNSFTGPSDSDGTYSSPNGVWPASNVYQNTYLSQDDCTFHFSPNNPKECPTIPADYFTQLEARAQPNPDPVCTTPGNVSGLLSQGTSSADFQQILTSNENQSYGHCCLEHPTLRMLPPIDQIPHHNSSGKFGAPAGHDRAGLYTANNGENDFSSSIWPKAAVPQDAALSTIQWPTSLATSGSLEWNQYWTEGQHFAEPDTSASPDCVAEFTSIS